MSGEALIRIGGILQRRNLALIGVMAAPDRPGLVAAIFQALGREHLNAQFIVQSVDLNNDSHIQFCVAEEDLQLVLGVLQPIAEQIGARRTISRQPVACVAVFGPDFRERPGIAGLAFSALAGAHVNILAVSTSISTISCIIDDQDFERAMAALQGVFDLP